MNNNFRFPRQSRKRIVIGALLGVLLVAVLLTAWSLMRHHSATPKAQATVDESGLQTEDQLNNYKQEVEVDITSQGFLPQALRIPNNTRIDWVNKDTKDHRITISPGTVVPEQFDSNHLISVGGGYPFVIHKTGTFHYYDVTTPSFSGIVIVSAN